MLVLRTPDPQGLLDAIYAAIDKKEGYGDVLTWTYDNDKYLHHDPSTSNDWADKAWFRPYVSANKQILAFLMDGERAGVTQAVYGILQGRFLGMLIGHFPDLFTVHEITTSLFQSDIGAYIEAI